MRIGMLRTLQMLGSILVISRNTELQNLRELQEILDRERAGTRKIVLISLGASESVFGAERLREAREQIRNNEVILVSLGASESVFNTERLHEAIVIKQLHMDDAEIKLHRHMQDNPILYPYRHTFHSMPASGRTTQQRKPRPNTKSRRY